MFKAFVVGRLTGDPEVRQPQSGGNPYTNFSIAVNVGKNQDGSQKTTFIRVSAFNKQGEMIAQSCKKGHLIAVELNNMEVGAYISQSNGQAQGTLSATLSGFDFCEKRQEDAPQQSVGYGQPQYATPPQQYQQPQYQQQPPQYMPPQTPQPQYGQAPPQQYRQPPQAAMPQQPQQQTPQAAIPQQQPGAVPW